MKIVTPTHYRPISLVGIMNKPFESILNNRLIGHLNNFLCDGEYGFQTRMSTADILTVITHRISSALDSSSRVIALDIRRSTKFGTETCFINLPLGYQIFPIRKKA